MSEIHIFRHGETEWNLAGRMQGFKDSRLTPLGVKQAEEATKKISGVKFDYVYSSTSSRAFDTAGILSSQLGLHVHQEPNLREINLGDWEGMQHDEVKRKYKLEHELFWNKPSVFSIPNAEKFSCLEKRSREIVERIASRHFGKKILIVSHAAFIKCLLTSVEGRPLDSVWDGPFAANLSHSILHKDTGGSFKIIKFCDETWN